MLVIVNKAEFYATVDLSADDLKELLAECVTNGAIVIRRWLNGSITITGNVLIALTTVKLRWSATSNLQSKHHTLMPFTQAISPMKSIYRNRITSLNLN